MTPPENVAQHFVGKAPEVKSVYDDLLHALQQLGAVREVPKKSSIHLDRKTGFAGIYPRKQYLLLHFRTAYPIDSPRVHKQQQLSAQRYKHTIKLEGKEQIDAELMAWLKDAYQLAG